MSFLDLNGAGFCSLTLTHYFPRLYIVTRCNMPHQHSQTDWLAEVWKTFLLYAIWSRQGCAPVLHPHHTHKFPNLATYVAMGIKRFYFLVKSSAENKAEMRRAYTSATEKHLGKVLERRNGLSSPASTVSEADL